MPWRRNQDMLRLPLLVAVFLKRKKSIRKIQRQRQIDLKERKKSQREPPRVFGSSPLPFFQVALHRSLNILPRQCSPTLTTLSHHALAEI
jgi:hypothetical protein